MPNPIVVSLALAQFVNCTVVRDAEEPARNAPTRSLIAVRPPPYIEEGVLRHLFSRSDVSQHVHGKRVHRA